MLGFVLAAGKGERMRPLSLERPKALVPTLGVPQLCWGVAALQEAGVHRAWVNASGGSNGLPEAVRQAGAALGIELRVSPEPEEPLGTSGALHKVRDELDETFLIWNADVACSLPLARVVERHRTAGAPATLVGIPTPDRADLVAHDGWVAELVDRHLRRGPGHLYAGIGVFEPDVLVHVPEGVSHLFSTVMQGLARDGRGMALFEWSGYWADVADPGSHLRVNLDALGGALAPPGPLRSLVSRCERWDELAYVGRGAAVGGASLRQVVVGRGARVAPGARLERCVVWSGASVASADYTDAVITRQGVFAVDQPRVRRPRGSGGIEPP